MWDSRVSIFREDALVKGLVLYPFFPFFFFLTFLRTVLGSLQNWRKGSEIYHVLPRVRSLPIIKITHQRGAFVTADELRLTHRYHLKSTVGLGVHSLCGTFYGFGQMFDVMARIHHYSSIQNIFAALKILCAPPIHPFLPSSPWKPLIFLLSP